MRWTACVPAYHSTWGLYQRTYVNGLVGCVPYIGKEEQATAGHPHGADGPTSGIVGEIRIGEEGGGHVRGSGCDTREERVRGTRGNGGGHKRGWQRETCAELRVRNLRGQKGVQLFVVQKDGDSRADGAGICGRVVVDLHLPGKWLRCTEDFAAQGAAGLLLSAGAQVAAPGVFEAE